MSVENQEAADERGSNRTMVGLKRPRGTHRQASPCGSNRTMVGLKLDFDVDSHSPRPRSNRTMVGLKPVAIALRPPLLLRVLIAPWRD